MLGRDERPKQLGQEEKIFEERRKEDIIKIRPSLEEWKKQIETVVDGRAN